MNWARDFTGLSELDFKNVFKYEEKASTIIRIVPLRNVSCFSLL